MGAEGNLILSIVAWDGKSIACDSMSISGEYKQETEKMRTLKDGTILAWTGPYENGLGLIDWWNAGAVQDEWPVFQSKDGDWARLIVAKGNEVVEYEQLPYPQPVTTPYAAWGSGRDFAIGALAMGATAKEAVEVACKHCLSCGPPIRVADVKPCCHEWVWVDLPQGRRKRCRKCLTVEWVQR